MAKLRAGSYLNYLSSKKAVNMKNSVWLEINSKKIIEKSCDLMISVFFALPIRWDTIAAKNAAF